MSCRDEDRENKHASHLMEWRLSQANLDLEYLEAAKGALVLRMRRRCATCPTPERCERDLQNGDWEAGQNHYCPNAAVIDDFILGRK